MAAELEELIVAASSGNEESMTQLAGKIGTFEAQELREAATNFEFMFDSWEEAENVSDLKTKICIELAETDALDGQAFRNALNDAVKALLPPYILSQGVLKAIGARDTDVNPREVVSRMKKLQKVKSGAIVYQSDSKVWGKVTAIEKVTATLGVTALTTGSLISLPISSAINQGIFFDPKPEMFNILVPDKRAIASSAAFKQVFLKNALTEISENKLREIAQKILVPDMMSIDTFNSWWTQTATAAPSSGKRQPWDARSVLELHTLLEPNPNITLGGEEAEKLAKLFAGLRMPMTPKDVTMLADCIAILSASNPGPVIGDMFRPLRGKAPFWPADVNGIEINKSLEVWGHISVKLLPAFVKATRVLYTEQEMAELGCALPVRCLTSLFETVDLKNIAEAIYKRRRLDSDVLMYIWKNRSKLPRNMATVVDMDHIAEAISMENLPKEWATAQRELKRALFEKTDFQKFVIENADGDIPSIIDALQKVRTFQMGECQSLMVKLSRHSAELLQHIESEGKRLMGSSAESNTAALQPTISSQASVSRLNAELEDLIKVQIPENVAAIAHARSFGDFRENAEYDAAKERRRFLHRRRAELESLLGTVHGTNFKDIQVADHVVIGCTVTLADSAGKTTDYYVLGALDGDPERNHISYKTKMGEIMLDAKIGDTLTLPSVGQRKITAIQPIPEEMRKKLAEEA